MEKSEIPIFIPMSWKDFTDKDALDYSSEVESAEYRLFNVDVVIHKSWQNSEPVEIADVINAYNSDILLYTGFISIRQEYPPKTEKEYQEKIREFSSSHKGVSREYDRVSKLLHDFIYHYSSGHNHDNNEQKEEKKDEPKIDIVLNNPPPVKPKKKKSKGNRMRRGAFYAD